MADLKVGEVTHYYGQIGVAVIKVLKPIKVGDQIKVSGHGQDFQQAVGSMQIEHQQITEAKKGQDIGMKVDQPAKEGDEVFKVE